MEITLFHDLDKVFKSKIGRFAILYYAEYMSGRRKLKASDNFDKIFNFVFQTLGKLSVFYLDVATVLYFIFCSKEELKRMMME